METQTWKAHLALVLASLVTGSYHVVSNIALTSGVNKLVFCIYRDVIALVVLIPFAYFKERRSRTPLSRKIILYFCILGLTGIFGNQVLFLIGLKLTSPATTSAMQPSTPVFAFIFALLLGVEELKWKQRSGKAKVGGTLLCFSGAILMIAYKGPAIIANGLDVNMHSVTNGESSRGLLSFLGENNSLNISLSTWSIGVACLIGNCACLGFYICFQALLLPKYPAEVSVTAFSYLFGAVFMAFVGIFAANSSSDWILNSTEIFAVFYAGLLASALNFSMLSISNKMVGPTIVALYTPIIPVFSSLLSYFFLGSSIYLGSVLGGILIVGGLYIVTWGQKQTWKILLNGNQPNLHPFNATEDKNSSTHVVPLLEDSRS